MKSQMVDKVQGNNCIASNITTNADLKYKIFLHFFTVQDPITTPLPKENAQTTRLTLFSDGASTYGRKPGSWRKMYQLTSRQQQCKASLSIKFGV
eukprot:7527181-Ditylum_brightwellii.AAC.1